MANSSGCISILQITDLHILPSPMDTLLGVNTNYYFHAVLDLAFAGQQHYDLVLLTGDLAQEPCAASYRQILDSLLAYNIPCFCLPGNHDDDELMQQILNHGTISCRKQLIIGNWQMICLNSRIPGSPGGRLAHQELAFLEHCLKDNGDSNALIAVHHHCLKTESVWMDTMIIENSETLLAIVSNYPQVKAITTGHIHQEMDMMINGVRIWGTPSTCFQFTPKSSDFAVDTTMPGFRIIRLYEDGHIESEIVRLPGRLTGLQVGSQGY